MSEVSVFCELDSRLEKVTCVPTEKLREHMHSRDCNSLRFPFPGSLDISVQLGPSALSCCWPLKPRLCSAWRVFVLSAALGAFVCCLSFVPPASPGTTGGGRDLSEI